MIALEVSCWSGPICCVRTQIFPARRALSSVRHPVTSQIHRWIEAKRIDDVLLLWCGTDPVAARMIEGASV